MIQYFRSLLGIRSASSNRTVVGASISFDARELEYIKESNRRLTDLFNLSKQYRGTEQEARFRVVYEKTKKIHSYLISQKRVHELELFHIQNTEHFLNTFSTIINAYEADHKKDHAIELPHGNAPKVSLDTDSPVSQLKTVPVPPRETSHKILQQDSVAENTTVVTKDKLLMPVVSMSPTANVVYVQIPTTREHITKEVSFISNRSDKEAFLKFIHVKLGIKDISYLGNAMLMKASATPGAAKVAVPLIRWKGYTYAIDLDDYRLYPVEVENDTLRR
jgi:hypothetical protein